MAKVMSAEFCPGITKPPAGSAKDRPSLGGPNKGKCTRGQGPGSDGNTEQDQVQPSACQGMGHNLHTRLSRFTVSRWLSATGIRSRRPRKQAPLNARHKRECVQWAQQHSYRDKMNLAPHKVEWLFSILILPCWLAHLCLVMTWWRLQSILCSVKATGILRICNVLGDYFLWTQDPTDYSPRQPQWYKVSRWDSGRHWQTTFPAVLGRTANLYGWQCLSSSGTPCGCLTSAAQHWFPAVAIHEPRLKPDRACVECHSEGCKCPSTPCDHSTRAGYGPASRVEPDAPTNMSQSCSIDEEAVPGSSTGSRRTYPLLMPLSRFSEHSNESYLGQNDNVLCSHFVTTFVLI